MRSTSGAGFAFEDLIGAWLLLKMLLGEAMPGMASGYGVRLQSQTAALEWLLDDHLVTCRDGAHLAISCKGNVQVTGSNLPRDFVAAAWSQLSSAASGPMHAETDRLVLVTRGRHAQFDDTWSELKRASTGSDWALALARIKGTIRQRTLFENIKSIVKESAVAITDEEVLGLIAHIELVPTDFDLAFSKERDKAITEARRLLLSGDAQEGAEFWDALVDRVRISRLGDGTIDLASLLRGLSRRFKLKDHPDFEASWRLFEALSAEQLKKIDAVLPSGHALKREEDTAKLIDALSRKPLVVLFGESGAGKSALAKSTLERHFPDARKLWLGPEEVRTVLNKVERLKIGLTHALLDTLAWSPCQTNIVVLDAAERIRAEDVPLVRELILALVTMPLENGAPAYRILIIGQTDAWAGGLQGLLGTAVPATVETKTAPVEEVKHALRAMPPLAFLCAHDDAIKALTNLRALAWVVQAAAHFQLTGGTGFSVTAVVDALWKYWTDDRPDLQGIVMRLAEREASFERSVALSTMPTPDLSALGTRPPQLPLLVTSQNRIEFQHDLAAEWARFEKLKEVAHDASKWTPLAGNPLWLGALRLLGQFLLRQRVNDMTAWDLAMQPFDAAKQGSDVAADVLLDALCLDPLAESLLNERVDLLLADHGALLNRLLRRFLHIATVPGAHAALAQLDPSLSLHVEAQYRMPIIARWPAIVRFLAAHRDRVAELMSPVVANLCERWLTTIPVELAPAVKAPYRLELADLALRTVRVLQVAQGKGVIFADNSEKPMYVAALAGAPDMPEEVSQWALEMARRRPWDTIVVAKIAEHHAHRAKEHAERLASDPEYRRRHEERSRLPTFIPSARELPPWPLGPEDRLERDFRGACLHSNALVPLMRVRPDVAIEILHATMIEESPEEEYGRSRLDDRCGLEFDQESYPTAYWNSQYFSFLQVHPEQALSALITLIEFCTDRWESERRRFGWRPIAIAIASPDGSAKEFRGNHEVFDWAQANSSGAGQLHCALAALEKWLRDLVEAGTDIGPYADRLLKQTTSAAFLGVLINIGKFRPSLFEGILRPLLANRDLYHWDTYRAESQQMHFAAVAWAHKGETVFQAARDWCLAPYRARSLRQLAGALVAWKPAVAEFLANATETWETPSDRKGALELRMLKAELDQHNYRKSVGSDGKVGMVFDYPENLKRDLSEYDSSIAPAMTSLVLPARCLEFLSTDGQLDAAQGKALAETLAPDFLSADADFDQDLRQIGRIAAAATLLARGGSWLDENPSARETAKKIVQDRIDKIGDEHGLLLDRALKRDGELTFVAHALMQEVLASQVPSDELAREVIRVLTSGDEDAVRTLMSLGYRHRAVLKDMWRRLLELSLLWSALALLSPRSDESEGLKKLWAKWLAWLRKQSLAVAPFGPARASPLLIARRAERLQRRRWVREYIRTRGTFGGDPAKRRSAGLDSRFLLRAYAWLFEQMREPAGIVEAEWPDRLDDVKDLLALELSAHEGSGDDDDRDEPPSAIGYELMPALASAIARLPVAQAAALWKPILALGGKAHFIVGNFIDNWFLQFVRGDMTLIAAHWRAMIEFALASPNWSSGRRWFHGQRMMGRLLGYGAERSLDQIAAVPRIVHGMLDLYASWAKTHLHRDEDHIAYLCGFLSSASGRLLRLKGIQWLDIATQTQDGRTWYRSTTGGGLVDFLDVVLSDNAEEVSADGSVRDAVLRLIALLVKRQVPAALALQERAKVAFRGIGA